MEIVTKTVLQLFVFTEKALNKEKDLSDYDNDNYLLYIGKSDQKKVLAKSAAVVNGQLLNGTKLVPITKKNILEVYNKTNGEGVFYLDSYYREVQLEDLLSNSLYKKKVSSAVKIKKLIDLRLYQAGFQNRKSIIDFLVKNKEEVSNLLNMI